MFARCGDDAESACCVNHVPDGVLNRGTLSRMRSSRTLTRLVPLAAVTALVALFASSCKDKPAENTVDAASTTPSVAPMASAPAASASASAAASEDRHGDGEGRRVHGGPSSMLFTAAKGLELKDDQKAKVEAAEKTARTGADDATRDAMKASSKELHADLVAGIKAGKIDAAKLEPRYVAIDKAAQVSHEKDAEALGALHTALDATQRKTVVADVRAKMAARENKMERRDGGPGGPDGGRGPDAKRSVDRLTRGLELDPEQQKKVDAIVAKNDGKGGRPDPVEMKKRLDTLLAAFEKDTFDAKKVEAFDAKKARGPMDHEAKVLAQLVPILTPEQREKLAARMEKGPNPHGRRGGHGGQPRQMAEGDDDD